MTAVAETGRVLRARGDGGGVCDTPLRCLMRPQVGRVASGQRDSKPVSGADPAAAAAAATMGWRQYVAGRPVQSQ